MSQQKHFGFEAQILQKKPFPPAPDMLTPSGTFFPHMEQAGHVVERHFSEQ
jgi:hypothetical protein